MDRGIMKKPKSVDIFGETYKIEYKKNLGNDGVCHKDTKLIEIDDSLTGLEFKKTLIHEYIHAVCSRLGISQAIGSEVEEVIAESFSNFFNDHWDFEL